MWGVVLSSPVFAQKEENKEAPQILTTDLTRRQEVNSSQLDVSFVIYDDDAISEVTINGEKQDFIPANTLSIDKRLRFKRGTNTIVVTAVDEKGNKRTNRYLVAFGTKLEEAAPAKKEGGFDWKIAGSLQYNSDSNPNNDLGLPPGVDTGDVTIEGQIADDEQSDTQTVANLVATFTFGKLKALAGFIQSDYSKDIYEHLDTQTILAGVSYGPRASEKGLAGQYMLLDVNMGGEDFAQYHIINAGYQIGQHDKEDGTTRNLLGVVYNHKVFADSDLDTGSTLLFQWERTNLDAEKLDFFKSMLAYGNGNDGTEESEFSAFMMDLDWSNKWESGLLQGTGFGLHYKEYPNQEPLVSDAGDSRVDVPFRFSFHLGWAFTKDWALKFNYKYKVNISSKDFYYRTITGIQLNGAF